MIFYRRRVGEARLQVTNMHWPTTLHTERLVLRPPAETDSQSIFDTYAQDPDVTRYLVWRPHQHIEETAAFIQRCAAGWNTGSELTWMLRDRVDDTLLGAIGVRPDGHKASLGYVLGRRYWGRGLMPEAARAVLNAATQMNDVFRLWGVCDAENHASARVMEKVGMVREGLLRRWIVHPNVSSEPRDALWYAWVRLREERHADPRPSQCGKS